jgi:hypothetical protein
MTSAINPNDIDGTYPVAGQDNNSQGFRDNFTNTKTNFQYAANEITDLQNNAILKAALTGTTLNNNMNGSPLSAANISGFSAVAAILGTTSGSVTINYTTGHYQTVTATSGAPISLAFTNFPAAGNFGIVRVAITILGTASTVTLPAAVSVGVSNLQGYSAGTISYDQTGTYTYDFTTSDGGTTISIFDCSRNLDPIYLPSNQSMSGTGALGAISLATTATYIATTGVATATLATGTDGQIKTIMHSAHVANCVITVSSAGWKTSGTGTITLSAIGQAVTLQYINSKWYAIGNNGTTFA